MKPLITCWYIIYHLGIPLCNNGQLDQELKHHFYGNLMMDKTNRLCVTAKHMFDSCMLQRGSTTGARVELEPKFDIFLGFRMNLESTFCQKIGAGCFVMLS